MEVCVGGSVGGYICGCQKETEMAVSSIASKI